MENFLLFVVMCVLLIILPGPDTAIITKNTVLHGKKSGLQTMSGTLCALMIHTSAAVLGLSAIIMKSAFVFSIIKYIGAMYLLYLGAKTLYAMTRRKPQLADAVPHKNDTKSSFMQGILTNLLNPKVAVFFLTFLPQFLTTGSDPLLPFFLMGVTYTVLTALWFVGYVYLLHQIRSFMNKPSTQKAMEGITGAVLILFGIKLAFEKI